MTYPCCRSSFAPLAWLLAAALVVGLAGCQTGPVVVPEGQRRAIDRKFVEYPSGVEMVEVVRNLTGPVDVEVDPDGNLIVAESGRGGYEPRIFAVRPDGSTFYLYPTGPRLPFGLTRGPRLHGPVGGICVYGGKVYVTHRDESGMGVVTALDYDGTATTVVGNLPARGDHALSDIALSPVGRLWFGVGSATNSGVVGLDNWQVGWVKDHPRFSDVPYTDLKLTGFLFRSKNPLAGLFGAGDVAVTSPFLPFNTFGKTRIGVPGQRADRPTAAVFSVDPAGGGLRVEAYGVREPVGVGFSQFTNPYMTNRGMQLRGTRPIKDDPDALLRIAPVSYGWPDYTADLNPVTEARYQPDPTMIRDTGYDAVSFLIDHDRSNTPPGGSQPLGLTSPTSNRGWLLAGVFRPLSGAARFDFVPDHGPFRDDQGDVVVALAGDRAPFATSGQKLTGPIGHRVVRVAIDQDVEQTERVFDFVRNTSGGPASASEMYDDQVGLERPTAVKFDPRDGSMYIVDFGRMRMKGGRERVSAHTGRIFKLRVRPGDPSTQPATAPTTGEDGAAVSPAAVPDTTPASARR